MEIGALASFLAPFIGQLLKLGDRAVDEVGDKGWEFAKALWGKLWPRMEEDARARGAAEDVAEAPDDEDRRAALRVQLKKLIETDPALAGELERIWREAEAADVVVSGDRAVGIGGSVSDSSIVTGDQSSADRH